MRRLLLIIALLCVTTCLTAQITITSQPTTQTLCYDVAASEYSDVTFSVGATVPNPGVLSYQWQVSTLGSGGPFTNVSNGGGITYTGANSSSLTISGAGNAANGYYYQCVISCTSCGGAANKITTPAQLKLPFTLSPAFQGPLCAGSALTFKANETGGAGSIMWYFQGGVTDDNFNHSLPSPTLANAGAVVIIASTAGNINAGCRVRYDANVELETVFAMTLNNPGPFCAGTSVSLDATAANPVIYKWTYPDGTVKNCSTPTTSCPTASITYNTPNNYTYTLFLDNGKNGNDHCETTKTFTITVNAIPSAPTITSGGATSFCTGGSVTLSSSAVSGNQWYVNGNLINGATGQTYVATTAGVYTVNTTSNNCASPLSNSITVTVTNKPSITATSNSAVCAGNTISLGVTSIAGATYSWTGPNGFTSSQQNPSISNSTLQNAGTYNVTATLNGCSSDVSSTNMVVNALPSQPTISAGGPTTFCAGGSVTLNSNAGSGNQWYLNGGAIPGATSPSLIVNTAGNYTVIVTDGNTCSSPASAGTNVTVNALPAQPTISAGGLTTFCAGGSVTLTASAGTTFQWYQNGNILAGATSQSLSVNASGNYSVTVTNGFGCVSVQSAATSVTVNTLPVQPSINASGSTTFCSGGNVTLTSSASAGNQWYLNGVPIAGQTNQTLLVNASGSYTVITTNSNGCVSPSSAATNVTVNSLPLQPSVTSSGPTTFCGGGNVVLTSSAGTTYQWYANGTAIPGETNQNLVVTASGNYSVIVTNTSACASPASAGTSVTVNPLPIQPSVNSNTSTTFCAGGNVTLTSSAATGNQWYVNGILMNGQTGQSVTVNSSGIYTVITTDGNGCSSPSSSGTNVTVNPLPAQPTINAGGPTTFCAGGSVTLTSSSASGNQWYLNGAAIAGATSQNLFVNASGNYTVVVTDGNTCSSPASAGTNVTVNALPAQPTISAGGPTTFCAGGSVSLTASAGTTYQWYQNGNIIFGATSQSLSVNASGNYSVTVTNGFGCVSVQSAATSVTVNALPVQPSINASGSTTFCSGGNVTLTSSASAGNQWYLNGAPIAGQTNQTLLVNASGSYTVITTNSNGCVSPSSTATNVIVNSLPIITGSNLACVGATTQLTGDGVPAATNPWVSSNTGSATVNNSGLVTGVAAGTSTITYTNSNGCQQTLQITTNVLPTAAIAYSQNSACAVGVINVSQTGQTGGSYSASPAGLVLDPANGSVNLGASNANTYTVTYTFSNPATGCVNSTTTSIQILPVPIVSLPPSNTSQSLCQGSTPNAFSVTSGAPGTETYQWFINTVNATTGGTAIQGASASSYTPTTNVPGTFYYYAIVANTSSCTVTSTMAGSITVYNAPVFTTNPSAVPQNVCNNLSTSPLTVAADPGIGTLTGIQWYSNNTNSNTGGTLIGGATSLNYTPPIGPDGTVFYYAVATNSFNCTAASTTGAVTIFSAPVITTQPSLSSQIVCQNITANAISVAANAGSGSITGYQWYSNTVNANNGGTIVAGATGSSYTPSTSSTGTLYYYVEIKNSNGCIVMSGTSGSVTVNDIPVISLQPSTTGQVVCNNQNPTPITTNASTATGTITGYQWYSNTANSNVGGTVVPGATSNSYVPSVTSDGTLYYYAIATNSFNCTTASSTSGAITVHSAPTINIQPSVVSQTVCQNITANNLTVSAAAGSGNIAGYQWYSNTTNSNNGGTIIAGATGSVYTPSSSVPGILYYYVVVQNTNGCSVQSAVSGSVTVNDIPVISLQPSKTGQVICDNQVPTAITVTATTATGNITGYQWYSTTSTNNVGGTAVAGATGTAYVPSVASDGTFYYYAIATNSFNCTTASATSGAITVYSAPVFTLQPSVTPQTICQNLNPNTLIVSVTAGSGNIAGYQWYSNTVNANAGGIPISGATGANYTPSTATAGTSYYYVVIQNTNGCSEKSAVSGSLTVNHVPVISLQPSKTGQIVCDNKVPSPIVLNASTPSGTITGYQWYSNNIDNNTGGVSIAGATGTTYVPSVASDGTQYYYAVVTNSYNCTTNSGTSGAITVYSAPVITIQPSSANQNVCVNAPALSVEANAGSGTILSYQWYSNTSASNTGGTVIPGATSNIYTPSSSEVGTKYFYCIISNSNGCSEASAASGQVKVYPIPIAAISGTSITCETTTINLAAADAGIGAMYSWNTPASGTANGIGLSINNVLPSHTGNYTLTVVKDGCTNVVSKYVSVTPLPLAQINGQTDVCEGSILQLTASDAGLGSVYTWLTSAGNTIVNRSVRIVNVPLAAAGKYDLTVTRNGCSKTVSTLVSLRALPQASVSGPNEICERETLILQGSSTTPGTTFAWTGPSGYATAGSIVNISNAGTVYSGNFTLAATKNGCTRFTDKAVTVKPLPITAIQGKAAWCEGNNITLNAEEAGPTALYKWTLQQQLLSTSKQLIINNAGLSNSGEYKLTVTLSGCSDETNKKLTVAQTPVVQLNAVNPICQYYDAFNVTANEFTGLPGNGVFSGQSISSTGNFNPTKSGDFLISYTYTANNGCAASASQTVKVLPGVLVNAGPDKVQLGTEGTQLAAVISGKYNSLSWTNITGINSTSPAPFVNPINTTTYNITLKNDAGCIASDDVTVKVVYLKIPNVFSPNGDGIHDKWIVDALADFPNCTVQIFDRWGQRVFASDGYSSPWDGTIKGQPAPMATYYYIINLNDKPRKPYAGWLQILR